MQYGRRDFESYRDLHDGDRWDTRDRRYAEQWRSQDNEGFRGDRSDDHPARLQNRESRDFESRNRRLDYPDRYSAGEGFRESFTTQGARRSHLKCRDIMTRNVTTCNTDTNIEKIAQLMRYEDIGAIPVL